MYTDSLSDRLEIDFGIDILSDLTGQQLSRNGEKVRLFDETNHTSEAFFKSDEQGKPYIQNWQEGRRYYPLTAYCQAHNVDWKTAIQELSRQYGLNDSSTRTHHRQRPPRPAPKPRAVDFIPNGLYAPCCTRFEKNGLFVYLSRFFEDEQIARSIFEMYRLGTSKRWRYEKTLATTLPQYDTAGNLRQVKIIPFHPHTGKRAKDADRPELWNERTRQYQSDEGSKVYFAGKSILGNKDANLSQCYFGEDLLSRYPDKRVILVEGESTALVMSAIYDEFICLATGGATAGRWDDPDKFSVFKGRTVVLWPDSGKYADWSHRAIALQGIAQSLTVSRHVEDNAPMLNMDLRDLLTWPQMKHPDGNIIYGEPLPPPPDPLSEYANGYPDFWDDKTAKLHPAWKSLCRPEAGV